MSAQHAQTTCDGARAHAHPNPGAIIAVARSAAVILSACASSGAIRKAVRSPGESTFETVAMWNTRRGSSRARAGSG